MRIACWSLMGLAVQIGLGCGGRDAPPPMTATAPPPPPPAATEPTPPPEATTMLSPDVELAGPISVDPSSLAWMPAPDALPPGAQVAVLEGTPPFPANTSYTIALKLPPNYTIPPHTHLVTERVTVLQGSFALGHGEAVDRGKAKVLGRGGFALMPAGHAHFAFTAAAEAIITLQGVGPWGIAYVNPADDPREPAPPKPDPVVSRWDAPASPMTLLATEVAFAPAPPGMLPPGAELAVIEGDPSQDRAFTIRIRVPDGYKFPVHSHSVTDRLTMIDGTLMFAIGDTWRPDAMRALQPGAIAVTPRGVKHYAQAKGTTTFQVIGTGPFDVIWADPAEDPAQISRAAR